MLHNAFNLCLLQQGHELNEDLAGLHRFASSITTISFDEAFPYQFDKYAIFDAQT